MNVEATNAAMAGRAAAPVTVRARSEDCSPQSAPLRRGEDTLEVSSMATMLSKKSESGERIGPAGIRVSLVERIQREIDAGTYDSADKLDIALDRMIDEIM